MQQKSDDPLEDEVISSSDEEFELPMAIDSVFFFFWPYLITDDEIFFFKKKQNMHIK
jgi:hypothetical protein